MAPLKSYADAGTLVCYYIDPYRQRFGFGVVCSSAKRRRTRDVMVHGEAVYTFKAGKLACAMVSFAGPVDQHGSRRGHW